MTDLGPGDRIVCVSNIRLEGILVRGAIYTVHSLVDISPAAPCRFDGCTDLSVAILEFPHCCGLPGCVISEKVGFDCFCPNRFRPLRGSFDYLAKDIPADLRSELESGYVKEDA